MPEKRAATKAFSSGENPQYRPLRFAKIGCFHFVLNTEDPFTCLNKSLNKHPSEHIKGSLIVLPEAFNFGSQYYRIDGRMNTLGSAKIPLHQALAALKSIARERTVVFVTSLIADRFNSAYWIGCDGLPELLCHKLSPDGSNTYITWDGRNPPAPPNPIERCGARVGALICLDARVETAYRTTVLDRFSNCVNPIRILCIPGRMVSHPVPSIDTQRLYSVGANCGPQLSVIRYGATDIAQPADLNQNEICLVDLSPALLL